MNIRFPLPRAAPRTALSRNNNQYKTLNFNSKVFLCFVKDIGSACKRCLECFLDKKGINNDNFPHLANLKQNFSQMEVLYFTKQIIEKHFPSHHPSSSPAVSTKHFTWT